MSKVPAGIRANAISGTLAAAGSLPEDRGSDRAAFARVPSHDASSSATTQLKQKAKNSRTALFRAEPPFLGPGRSDGIPIGPSPMGLKRPLVDARAPPAWP